MDDPPPQKKLGKLLPVNQRIIWCHKAIATRIIGVLVARMSQSIGAMLVLGRQMASHR